MHGIADDLEQEHRKVSQIAAALHETKLVIAKDSVVVLRSIVVLRHVDIHGTVLLFPIGTIIVPVQIEPCHGRTNLNALP
jgi:hypothetical protein